MGYPLEERRQARNRRPGRMDRRAFRPQWQGKLGSGEIAGPAELAVFRREGDSFAIEALEESKILFLSGQPIDEPVVGQGPFVMNTRAEIEAAFADYRDGRLGRVAERA